MNSKLKLSWSIIWLTIYYITQGYCMENKTTCMRSTFTGMEELSEEFKKAPQLQEEIINVSFQNDNPMTQEASGTYQLITYYEKMQMPENYSENDSRFIIQKHPFYGDWRLSKIFRHENQKSVVIDSSANKNNLIRNPFIFYGFFALQNTANEIKISNDTLKKELTEQHETNKTLLKRISKLEANEKKSISIIQKLKLQQAKKDSRISILENELKSKTEKLNSEISKNIQFQDSSMQNVTSLTDKTKQLQEQVLKTENKLKNLYSNFEKKFNEKTVLQNKKYLDEISFLKQQNIQLKESYDKEIINMSKTFAEKMEKLNEIDKVQSQLKEAKSENEKLQNIQNILEDEIKNLTNSNKQWKQDKKKLKECEEKLMKEENKSKSLTASINQKLENENKKLESEKNLFDAKKKLQNMIKKEEKVNAKIESNLDCHLKKSLQNLIAFLETENLILIPQLPNEFKLHENTFLAKDAKLILGNLTMIMSDSTYENLSVLLLFGGFYYVAKEVIRLMNGVLENLKYLQILDDIGGNFYYNVLIAVEGINKTKFDEKFNNLKDENVKIKMMRIREDNVFINLPENEYEKSIMQMGCFIYGRAIILQSLIDYVNPSLGKNKYIDLFIAKMLESFS